MRISDLGSDVCASDLAPCPAPGPAQGRGSAMAVGGGGKTSVDDLLTFPGEASDPRQAKARRIGPLRRSSCAVEQKAEGLTRDRVERLLADLSARSRTETATIVATELSSGRLSEAERAIAIDIVTVLAQDAIQAVREAVAEHLKSSPYLPRHLALSLAHDVATVADRTGTRLNSSH